MDSGKFFILKSLDNSGNLVKVFLELGKKLKTIMSRVKCIFLMILVMSSFFKVYGHGEGDAEPTMVYFHHHYHHFWTTEEAVIVGILFGIFSVQAYEYFTTSSAKESAKAILWLNETMSELRKQQEIVLSMMEEARTICKIMDKPSSDDADYAFGNLGKVYKSIEEAENIITIKSNNLTFIQEVKDIVENVKKLRKELTSYFEIPEKAVRDDL